MVQKYLWVVSLQLSLLIGDCKYAKVTIVKKSMLSHKYGILPLTWCKSLCALCSESNLWIFLKIRMVVKQKMDYPGGNTGDFEMRQFALGNLLCK